MGDLHILLVEDDTDLRALMRRHLSGRGYQVAVAGSVAEARRCLDAFVPDLLILDISLPDGTGWEIARYVRSLMGAHVPIVVCSSHEPSVADLHGSGIEGYIPKPFDLATLAARVDAALVPADRAYVPSAATQEADDRDVAFYSSLAHDMRTPISTLRTAVESLLADDVEWDEEARREFLEAIASSAERVSKYALNVLDLARLDAGAMPPRLQRVDPDETIEALTRVLRTRRPVPPVCTSVAAHTPPVTGDPGFIHRILLELVENGLRCSSPGTEVTVRVCGADGEVQWRVTDCGPGITLDERERIFDRHYRMDASARNVSRGPRLSLYLAREMARLLGGHLWADAGDAGGACFCLALPAAGDEEQN